MTATPQSSNEDDIRISVGSVAVVMVMAADMTPTATSASPSNTKGKRKEDSNFNSSSPESRQGENDNDHMESGGADDENDDDDDDDDDQAAPQQYSLNEWVVWEEGLARAQLELMAIRGERERQRLQLGQLRDEQAALLNQKDLRQERHQLQQQYEDLQATADDVRLPQQVAMVESLEQTKTRRRQLKRTLQLIQDGVEGILEQSAQDNDHSAEGLARASHRQLLLTQLLRQRAFHHQHSNNTGGMGDDDIDEEDDGHPPTMFHENIQRYDSIDSMVSEIASVTGTEAAPITYRVLARPITRSAHSRPRSRSVTKSINRTQDHTNTMSCGDRSRSRSRRSKSSSPSRTQRSSRSAGSPSNSGGKQSGTRKVLRRTKSSSSSASAVSRSHGHSVSTTSSNSAVAHIGGPTRRVSLMQMLENGQEADGYSDENSADTPKTTNTQT